MERSNIPPQELASLASQIVRELRAQGAEINIPSDAAEERAARDVERRSRDEATLRRDAFERKERLNQAVLEHVLPPKVLRFLRSGKVREKPASKAALTWFDENLDRILVLRGAQGVGKTNAAGLVVQASVERGKRSVSWHRPDDFVSAVLHAYDEDSPELGTDLVVIDDMGTEKKADFALALTTFLDDRGARMVITSNDEHKVSVIRYRDSRLMERFKEDTLDMLITGSSMRGVDEP